MARNIMEEQELIKSLPDELLEQGLKQPQDNAPFTQYLGAIEVGRRSRERQAAQRAAAAADYAAKGQQSVVQNMLSQAQSMRTPDQAQAVPQPQGQPQPQGPGFAHGGEVGFGLSGKSNVYANGGMVEVDGYANGGMVSDPIGRNQAMNWALSDRRLTEEERLQMLMMHAGQDPTKARVPEATAIEETSHDLSRLGGPNLADKGRQALEGLPGRVTQGVANAGGWLADQFSRAQDPANAPSSTQGNQSMGEIEVPFLDRVKQVAGGATPASGMTLPPPREEAAPVEDQPTTENELLAAEDLGTRLTISQDAAIEEGESPSEKTERLTNAMALARAAAAMTDPANAGGGFARAATVAIEGATEELQQGDVRLQRQAELQARRDNQAAIADQATERRLQGYAIQAAQNADKGDDAITRDFFDHLHPSPDGTPGLLTDEQSAQLQAMSPEQRDPVLRALLGRHMSMVKGMRSSNQGGLHPGISAR